MNIIILIFNFIRKLSNFNFYMKINFPHTQSLFIIFILNFFYVFYLINIKKKNVIIIPLIMLIEGFFVFLFIFFK